MSALPRYRRWQLWALEKNLLNIEHIVTTITDPAAFSRRDGGDGWMISEVLGHLADVDSYFLGRARAFAENNDPPPSSGKSPDEMVIEAGYAEQDALDLLEKWKAVRVPYHAFLAALPEDDEELWERPGRPADGGGFTLNDQLILSAYHDLDHIHQIVKIIRGS
ncbi:MAG: DinB family protein [Chloroflexi bacterium]|nr:DinB family protein [Chloroflexota bacterium]